MYITRLVKSLKPTRREHWMMLCILLYALSNVLAYYIPVRICFGLKMICGIVFFCTLITNIKGIPLHGIVRLVYLFLTLWTIFLTLRMFFYDDVKNSIQGYHGVISLIGIYFNSIYFIPNLLPLIILTFSKRYRFDFKYLWRLMWLLCICYLCYYPIAVWGMTHYSWSLDLTPGLQAGDKGTYTDFVSNSTVGISSLAPVVIMVFFKKYMTSKNWHWFLIAYIGGVFIQIFLARRGGLATSLLYLVLAWLMYSMFDKRTSTIKMILVATFAIVLGYVLFTGTADSLFSTLLERGIDDSRSGVEESFYEDMKSENDWIFGRGWFGQYWDSNFGFYRSAIETGYLALILRGGYLYLIPYVMTLALTFLNGFFRSKNLFCKSFAIMALMQIVSLYPWGWPQFTFLHFIIWLGVWVCNSASFRKLSDNQVKELYFTKI